MSRLYAAGDVARLGWDGTIEFLGRRDQQLKIRGLRIEPAEIERVLLEHAGVREAVVSAWDNGGGDRRLAAYFTPAGAPVSASELRAHARQTLPDHMVPSAFVALERLPLTPNGKVDRSALPAPELVRADEIEYVAPRPGLEESIAGIWRQVLRVDRIGAGDNFFSLGGHSLLAAQVRSRIQSTVGVDLPLTAIFEDQTLSALALRLEMIRGAGANGALPPLGRVPRADAMPASFAQELMWEAEQADPGSPAHWIQVGLRIRGPLDVERLVRSVQAAAERHELLRTTYRSVDGSLFQVILPASAPEVRLIDAPGPGGDGVEAVDLGARPPVRAELVRTRDNDHTLNVFVHRIVCDGLATRLLLGEIGALYMNAVTGTSHIPLLDTAVQYADYAAWEHAWLTDERLAREVEFFGRAFTAADAPFGLPTDRPRPLRPRRCGARIPFEIPRETSDAVQRLATRERASLYMLLLAAFASALGKHSGRAAVVIGAPVSRRNHPGTEQLIGPFMNTVPLQIDVSRGGNLRELSGHVKAVLLAALSHQDAPFHRVKARLTAALGPAAAGVGEVVFVMGDPAPREIVMGDISLTRVEPERVTARRDLMLTIVAADGDIAGTMTYDRDLFDAATIERIVGDFQTALASARD